MHRMTKQRRMLLHALHTTKSHPTADELHHMVRQSLPHVSLGTVYRNLDILVRAGAVRKLDTGGGQYRYDGDTSDHCHLRCTDCGRMEDLMVDASLEAFTSAAGRLGYTVEETRVDLVGTCPACQAAQAAEETQAHVLSIWPGMG